MKSVVLSCVFGVVGGYLLRSYMYASNHKERVTAPNSTVTEKPVEEEIEQPSVVTDLLLDLDDED